jgi:hypothetical protein
VPISVSQFEVGSERDVAVVIVRNKPRSWGLADERQGGAILSFTAHPAPSPVLRVRRSVQLIGDLVERGLDASLVLFAARRARCAGRADDFVAHLDRERPLVGDDVGQMDQAERRVGLDAFDQGARKVRAV